MAGSSPIRKLSPPMKHLYSIQLFLFEPENLKKNNEMALIFSHVLKIGFYSLFKKFMLLR